VILHKPHGKACPDIAGTANKSNLHAKGIIPHLFYSFAPISEALAEPESCQKKNVADSAKARVKTDINRFK
jgi:hypothetical protein